MPMAVVGTNTSPNATARRATFASAGASPSARNSGASTGASGGIASTTIVPATPAPISSSA